MATDPAYLEHILDLFQGLGRITTGRMFSGTALYVEGDVMFACVLGDTVWLKSDASTLAEFEGAGSHPFTYDRATGAQRVTSLMSLPESAMDDADEAVTWARLALGPAQKAAEKKRVAKSKKQAKGT
jgi:DNA transformation protein